jgi:hypothetical protein
MLPLTTHVLASLEPKVDAEKSQSVTFQPMWWHCYPLLHWHIYPKMSILFLQLGVQPPTQKCEFTTVYSNPLLNSFFVHEPNNKWSTNLYVHSWLHMPLSMPHISTNQTQNYKPLPFSLQKQWLECPQRIAQAYTKTCIIPRANESPPPLHHYNHACWNSMWKQEDKRTIKLEFPFLFIKLPFFWHTLTKNQQRIHLFSAWPIPLGPHSVYT